MKKQLKQTKPVKKPLVTEDYSTATLDERLAKIKDDAIKNIMSMSMDSIQDIETGKMKNIYQWLWQDAIAAQKKYEEQILKLESTVEALRTELFKAQDKMKRS